MYLFILRWTLGVFVLCPASVLTSRWSDVPNMKHNIRVSNDGNNSLECLQNYSVPCQDLDYVFEKIKEQNSTAVYVDVGYYSLKKSYTFWHVDHFAIIGMPKANIGIVFVKCNKNAGLSFIYSTGIIMKSIILSSCGANQNSTSILHQRLSFLTGLFLVNCINVTMDHVQVKNAPGIAIQLYDVTGEVNIFNSYFIGNGKRNLESLEIATPGGGFYLEYTYMGGLYPFNAPPEPIYQENGMFHFINTSFESNSAPRAYINDTVNQNQNNHIAFGRGGGASLFFKGLAKNNNLLFTNCHFDENYAEWGAGVFAEFHDSTEGNSIAFQFCHFHHNNASIGGGGARVGLMTLQDTMCVPNWVSFTSCRFRHNQAIFGGGISLFETTKYSYLNFTNQSFFNITSCVIEENFATVGSAIGSTLWDTNEYGIGGANTLKIFIRNSTFQFNQIIYTEDKIVSGVGALYTQGNPVILQNTHFISNHKTALVLDGAFLEIIGNVSFIKNKGWRGGAIALYGKSKIVVMHKANLTFIENRCSIQGGAIYYRAPGPQLVAFKTTQINRNGCFFHFKDGTSDYSVSFYGNRGPSISSGNSVYATTLQFCRHPGEARVNNSVLQWKSFHYYYANGTAKSDMAYEIVTDAITMEVNDSDWNTTPDKDFSPSLKLLDEKSNNVYGIIKIEVYSNVSNIELDPPSTFFLAKDKIETLQIRAKPNTPYNATLVTVDSQLVSQEMLHLQIKHCEPGFVWKGDVCKCDETQIGMSRCDDEIQNLYLVKGYWGGYAESSGEFTIVQCPENYCHCSQNNATSSSECFFDKDKICKGNREKQLCGKCMTGFSLKVGEDACTRDCMSGSHAWIGYLIGILLFITVLVFIIMFINFDPFSAYLNAWLYSYQVMAILVPGYMSFDPFLTFIIGLAHIQILGFGGVCMWSKMDDLQKLAFTYILPIYIFMCLCVLYKSAVKWPNNIFTRRLTQTSSARAFCTLFVLSYSTLVGISFSILHPVKIGDDYFVYHQGNVKYFSLYHAFFAIFALIILVVVGIFFPLLLIRRQWFTFIDKGLMRLLLDNLQRCFRDGYKWCAGFYFVCRFLLLAINMSAPPSVKNAVCCITLAVFVSCQPYAENGGTIVPYRILNISDAVLLCNLCLISSFGGSAASGVCLTSSYQTAFKTVISILSYVPLIFSLGLFIYFLWHKCRTGNLLLQDVD